MVKIEELLEPGETVIKKNRWRTEYGFEGAQGTLWLTNRRLAFTSSRWSKEWGAKLSPEHRDAILIPLRDIVNVERSWMGTLKILTDRDKKYEFRNVERDFATAVERARQVEQ